MAGSGREERRFCYQVPFAAIERHGERKKLSRATHGLGLEPILNIKPHCLELLKGCVCVIKIIHLLTLFILIPSEFHFRGCGRSIRIWVPDGLMSWTPTECWLLTLLVLFPPTSHLPLKLNFHLCKMRLIQVPFFWVR